MSVLNEQLKKEIVSLCETLGEDSKVWLAGGDNDSQVLLRSLHLLQNKRSFTGAPVEVKAVLNVIQVDFQAKKRTI